jgi:prepilin signal peptidase PulO-like enzyme (type II secretory pathway)
LSPVPHLTLVVRSAIAVTFLVLAVAACWFFLSFKTASLITLILGILVFLIGVLARDAGQADFTDDVVEEISTPFARAIVLREVPFLLVPILFAVIAYLLPGDLPMHPWLARFLGSVLGLLVGGGIVWFIRVLGTLGFNKIAMGEGDAHLMAGVGAVVGAPLVIIAFFTAPFVALLWAAVLKIMGKPNILPFGPWLSVAAILSLFIGNPLLAFYLSLMFP